MKPDFFGRQILVWMAGFFCMHAAYAVTFTPKGTPNLQDMLSHFSQDVPNLMRLVTAFAYVLGFFFVIKGIMELKQFGEQRSMMSQEHHLGKPLTYMFVGAMLIYLPSAVHVGIGTFWGQDANPYAWKTGSSGETSSVYDAVFLVIQLIGTISFIRGLVLLTQMGSSHQPGTFGRAMAHIIAGILCINLYGYLEAITTSLGIGQWSP